MAFMGLGKNKTSKKKQDKSLIFIMTFLIFCFAFQHRQEPGKNIESVQNPNK